MYNSTQKKGNIPSIDMRRELAASANKQLRENVYFMYKRQFDALTKSSFDIDKLLMFLFHVLDVLKTKDECMLLVDESKLRRKTL